MPKMTPDKCSTPCRQQMMDVLWEGSAPWESLVETLVSRVAAPQNETQRHPSGQDR